MSDKSTPSVSLSKSDAGSAATDPKPGPSGLLGKLINGGPTKPNPPKMTRYGVSALGVSALSALVTALALYGLKGWLFTQGTKSNPKPGKKGHNTPAELHSQVNGTIHSQLVATLVVIFAIGLVARACWIGRYWARWAVLGLWVLATLTQTFVGFFYVLAIGTSEPLAFKIPSFVAAVAFTVGMVLMNLRPSVEYLNLTRPAGAARPARRGMFSGGVREQVRQAESLPGSSPIRGRTAGSGRSGSRRSARTVADAPPIRGKQRADAGSASSAANRSAANRSKARVDSAAKGADLARARAKAASKSRRSGA